MTTVIRCDEVIAKYLEHLSGDFDFSETNQGCFLVTPFVRPDGEAIELELELTDAGKARITDMGETIGYLYVNGLTLSRSLLVTARNISKPFGVSIERNSLVINADLAELGEALHQIIQSSLSITDLIYRRRPNNRVRFDDEVESFIISQGTTYDADYETSGRLEKHRFKFHVNTGRNLLIQPLTAASESAAHTWSERWAYRFQDVLSEDASWDPIAILDDRSPQNVWTPHAVAPIQEFAVRWSVRENLAERLS